LKATEEEISWLRKNCSYLPPEYLEFLQTFRLYPDKQVELEWHDDTQNISIIMKGLWIETILYEIPILALVSEAYFRFVDTDWDYVGQYGKSPRGNTGANGRTRVWQSGTADTRGMYVFRVWDKEKTGLSYS
jgi:nicotinic acid phosphoribosyltransferase